MKSLLAKLEDIDKAKTIYNIHRCRAGWGIIFYYPEKEAKNDWKTGLSVEKYYPSFKEMVKAEWLKLQSKSGGDL
jgi:hypothetical protein